MLNSEKFILNFLSSKEELNLKRSTIFRKGLSIALCLLMCMSTMSPALAVSVDSGQNSQNITDTNISVDDGTKPVEDNKPPSINEGEDKIRS